MGYRSGYYVRSLVTRVGKLELRVPQDKQGRFCTQLFERYQRSEKASPAGQAGRKTRRTDPQKSPVLRTKVASGDATFGLAFCLRVHDTGTLSPVSALGSPLQVTSKPDFAFFVTLLAIRSFAQFVALEQHYH
jgi:Transposase, Mutator family